MEKTNDVRELVRQKYAQAATGGCGCGTGSSCCGGPGQANPVTGNLYGMEELDGLPAEMIQASLGCGNPTAMGQLYAGETVLDLGSGAGLDVLLSAHRVGPGGKAYGLDMTDEMLAKAVANRERTGIANAEFLKGHIEDIPLPAESVDVVISNCVINLSADKDKVLHEIFRVLRPGGRLAVADIVTTKPLPARIMRDVAAWAGCIAGALTETDYRRKLADAGFVDIALETTRVYDLTSPSAASYVPKLDQAELAALNGVLTSAFLRAKKTAVRWVENRDFSVRKACQDDLPAIWQLLTDGALPIAGVDADSIQQYLVAERNGIIGVVGLEPYDKSALLRSLTVAAVARKTGVADCLVAKALAAAKAERFSQAFLLTETAERYFAKRGFTVVSRAAIPAKILTTSALGTACPSTCTCMMCEL